MEVREDRVVLTEGLAIQWNAVHTVRVLNDRLVFRMRDGILLEVAGLPGTEVDAVFKEYSKFVSRPKTA